MISYRKRDSRELRMGNKFNLDRMSIDEMWHLHEEIIRVLSIRLTSEKRELEKRLARLRREQMTQLKSPEGLLKKEASGERRKYPKVFPKYQNSKEPFETWSGRGKQPRWLAAALKVGHTIDEFQIANVDLNSSALRRNRADVT